MHPAYSVILFTTASGAGYGLLALLGLVGLSHGPVSDPWFGAVSLLMALGLITAGLFSSMLHLGHPERAWRAVTQWRSSWLSREGVAALLTYVPALAFGGLWLLPDSHRGAVGAAGLLTALSSAVTIYCTGMIYASLSTIRQWAHPLVVPSYFAFSLATGAVLLLALAHAFGRGQPVQSVIAAAALALALGVKWLYWRSIDSDPGRFTIEQATGLGRFGRVRQWESAHTTQNFVMKEMGYRVARRHALRLRRLALAALALSSAAAISTMWLAAFAALLASCLAVALAAVGTLVERWLFFAEAEHVSMLYYGASRA